MKEIVDWINGFGSDLYSAFVEKERYLSYLRGLKLTLFMSIFAVLLGVAIGIIIAVVKYSAVRRSKKSFGSWLLGLCNVLCNIYINIIRGTPVYVQLLIIYNLIFTSRNTSPLISGIVCFGINSGAYVAEIIRAGLESVDIGQMEAGKSLGLNGIQTMKSIILPQAIKNILPALGNEFIVLIKETSIAGTIAITEVTKVAIGVGNNLFDILTPLYIAATMYLVIVLGLTKLLNVFERRLSRSDRR